MRRVGFALAMLLACLLGFYALTWCVFDVWIASFGSPATILWAGKAALMLVLVAGLGYVAYRCGRIAFRRTG